MKTESNFKFTNEHKTNKTTCLDIRNEVCPMTFVRTKLALERLSGGSLLAVTLAEGEACDNVPNAAAAEGHEILSQTQEQPGIWRLLIRKRVS